MGASKKCVLGMLVFVALTLTMVEKALAWRKDSKASQSQSAVNEGVVKEEKQSPAEIAKQQQLEQQKNILIANINAMRNQEITANVLQQLLNREVTELRRMQAVFCDQYGLNPDKWRQGLYEYDVNKGSFIEKTK